MPKDNDTKPKTTTFDLGQLTAEQAIALRRRLPPSYMRFQLHLGRCPLGYHVSITTDYQAPYAEVAELLISLLATT